VQALPTTKDGKIYIHLGTAYSATNMELQTEHPVYWHDGTGIRIWTGAEPSSGGGSTVSVTQSLTGGTQVGSISVDGNATALYAPTPPTASTTAPSMDGTASYGSGTSYARSNHVHPTDTSRAASSHDHGSITNAGAITSDTAAASGDKLVIADSSDSSKLKRSGIAFGSSTSTFLRNDGTWATPSGGGGGGGGSWTDITNQLTTTTFVGTVLTDGHMCVIISEQDGTTDDGVGVIIQDLPLPQDYVYFTASRYRTNMPLVIDTDGILKLVNPDEADSSAQFDGFTIIYPIASS